MTGSTIYPADVIDAVYEIARQVNNVLKEVIRPWKGDVYVGYSGIIPTVIVSDNRLGLQAKVFATPSEAPFVNTGDIVVEWAVSIGDEYSTTGFHTLNDAMRYVVGELAKRFAQDLFEPEKVETDAILSLVA